MHGFQRMSLDYIGDLNAVPLAPSRGSHLQSQAEWLNKLLDGFRAKHWTNIPVLRWVNSNKELTLIKSLGSLLKAQPSCAFYSAD